MYDLKQAPRQWYKKFDSFMHIIGFKRCEVDHYCYVKFIGNSYKKFDSFMHIIGFKRCEVDHYCYVKFIGNSYIILLLYVDDMLIVGSRIEEINNLKKQLSK